MIHMITSCITLNTINCPSIYQMKGFMMCLCVIEDLVNQTHFRTEIFSDFRMQKIGFLLNIIKKPSKLNFCKKFFVFKFYLATMIF